MTEQFDSAIAIGNRCSNVSPMVMVAAIILLALWIHVPISSTTELLDDIIDM